MTVPSASPTLGTSQPASGAPASGAVSRPSWQSHVVHLLVRARMRRHAVRPIDPLWVRAQMGKPKTLRRLLALTTGARAQVMPAQGMWPGGERVEWPAARDDAPTMLYLHGGGFIACSPETHRMLVASLVRRIEGRAFVPHYRLAPEHPFPAALDDALAAYRHLLQVERVDPARLVVAGDSAGGGLVLSLALALRDAGDPLPAALVTFSPWTDLAATGASLEENSASCAMFVGDTIRRAAPFYAGQTDVRAPLLSPLYGDYHGLPPLLVHASHDEVLRDDSVRVAERARRAGGTVELRLWPRVPHVWQFFPAVLPEARESLAATAAFVRRYVGGASMRPEGDDS